MLNHRIYPASAVVVIVKPHISFMQLSLGFFFQVANHIKYHQSYQCYLHVSIANKISPFPLSLNIILSQNKKKIATELIYGHAISAPSQQILHTHV